MATIQLKRGVEADRSSVTPASGEMLYTTDTKLVYVGDGSTAGGNPVGVGGGNVLEATASGALANGDLVVVNSDGTVSVVAQSSISEGNGTATTITTDRTNEPFAVSIGNGKIVVAYQDYVSSTDRTGVAIVMTVSGTSITAGTPVTFESANISGINGITYHEAEDVIVISYDLNSTLYAIAGSVSGTSITFGTSSAYETGYFYGEGGVLAYDPVNEKILAVYGTNIELKSLVLTVSGTSISYGPKYGTGSAVSSVGPNVVYDPVSGNMVITYGGPATTYYGNARTATISGTAVSYGTQVTYFSSWANDPYMAYDSTNEKIVIVFNDINNSNDGKAIVGTVTGTSLSFGTPVTYRSGNGYTNSVTEHLASGKMIVTYGAVSTYYGTAVAGTVSGTSISFGTPYVFNSAATYYFVDSVVYEPTNKQIVVEWWGSPNGIAATYTPAYTDYNLSASNYIGISDGAYADTATATIQVKGSVDDAQTGLTAGQAYYVQNDGTLSTTPATPSVFAGTAVSATEIIVKG